jgi:hypothetical protein
MNWEEFGIRLSLVKALSQNLPCGTRVKLEHDRVLADVSTQYLPHTSTECYCYTHMLGVDSRFVSCRLVDSFEHFIKCCLSKENATLLLALTSTVILGSMPHSTHDHTLLFHGSGRVQTPSTVYNFPSFLLYMSYAEKTYTQLL